jgi:predicted MFS family arabinose efflux permease
MIIESWLNEKSTNEQRGLVFSVYTIIQLTVITIGQLMLMLDEPTDFPLFSVASILISLSVVPLVLTKASVPAPIEAVRIDFRRLYRISPIGLAGCLVVGMTNGSFWALAPLFIQSSGQGIDRVAYFMSVGVLGGAIGQWPLGRLSDQVDRRRVIQIACAGAGVAGVALSWSALAAQDLMLAGAFAYGLFAFPLYAVSVAHTNDFVSPDGYVEAASGLLLVYALGAGVGPFFASMLVSRTGAPTLFLFTAGVHLLMLLYTVWRMPLRSRPSAAERSRFAEALVVAATTSSVDPFGEAAPLDVSGPSPDTEEAAADSRPDGS